MGDTATAAATLGLTRPNAAVELPQISVAAKDIELSDWHGDILAVAVTEKDVQPPQVPDSTKFENAVLEKLDGQLGGLLRAAAAEEEFTGKPGQSVVLRVQGQRFKRVALVGFVARSAGCLQGLGESVASLARAAQATSTSILLAAPAVIRQELKLNAAAAIASGIVLGLYEDSRYKSEWKKVHLKQVDLIGLGSGPEVDQKLHHGNHLSSGVMLARDLVNSPANVLTPGSLAEEAAKIASTYSDVFTATILDAEKCKELKMGSYLAVAAASETNPPYFIRLCYKPPGGNVKTKLALIGKGITFDSGGYNIKAVPVATIELMKKDMGGAAAVFGAAKVLGQIKPPGVEVHFISAASENMISGSGMRPGDIVTASNGKTIEVASRIKEDIEQRKRALQGAFQGGG